MVWQAALAGGLSLLSGWGAQQSAKKQAKTQAAMDYIANETNKRNVARTNATNAKIGQKIKRDLLKVKEVTTEEVTGGTTSGQDNYSYVDTAGMMKAAEAAGFNPVTFLNAGGMQAYTQTGSRGFEYTDLTTTTTRQGHNAVEAYSLYAGLMSPQTFQMSASTATKIPHMAEAVGDAGTAALNVFRQDESRQQSQDFQRELLNTQLSAIAKGQKANRTFAVPGYSTSGGTTVVGGGGLSKGVTVKNGKIEVTDPWSKDYPIKVDPNSADASQLSNRYGEPGDWLGGFYNMANDGAYTYMGRNIPTMMRAGMNNWQSALNPPNKSTRTLGDWTKEKLEPFRSFLFDPAL